VCEYYVHLNLDRSCERASRPARVRHAPVHPRAHREEPRARIRDHQPRERRVPLESPSGSYPVPYRIDLTIAPASGRVRVMVLVCTDSNKGFQPWHARN
jgi:hypothetical protein